MSASTNSIEHYLRSKYHAVGQPYPQSTSESSPITRFDKMAQTSGWGKQTIKRERREFLLLLQSYGATATSKLGLMKKACRALFDHLEESDISSITRCKKLLNELFINLCDFVSYLYLLDQGSPSALPPTPFASKRALKAYCIAENKFFPKEEAKQKGCGPLLKRLF